jgi:hypothetical protein
MLTREIGWLRWRPTLLLLGLASCAPQATAPPGALPTPASVTRDEPGGDAPDPHRAALERLLQEPWKRRWDKRRAMRVPLTDRGNWKRTRFWLIEHFTGFRYGDDVHALNVVFVQKTSPELEPTPRACMHQLERWADPQLKNFEVQMGPVSTSEVLWRGKPVLVRQAYGNVDYGLGRESFSLAWAAYPAYPDGCLVFSLAVPWRGQRELANLVRERWVREGLKRLKPATPLSPARHPGS